MNSAQSMLASFCAHEFSLALTCFAHKGEGSAQGVTVRKYCFSCSVVRLLVRCKLDGFHDIQVVALHDVSSTDAAIIYTMEPVLGAAFAYALLGERWGSLGWAGAGLIVVSSLAAQILGTESQKELPAPTKR